VRLGRGAGRVLVFQVPAQIEVPNPNPTVDLGGAVQVAPCAGVSVCGDFQVALWERDAAGQAAEGSLDLRSGQLPNANGPDTRPVLGRAQQLYLDASGACLTMAPTVATNLLADGLAVAGASGADLRDAHGTLVGQAVRGGDVQLGGALRLDVHRGEGALVVRVLDGVRHAVVDGRELAVATVQAGAGHAAWLWPGLAVAGLVAVPASVVVPRRVMASRQRLVDSRLEQCEAFFDRGDYDAMLAMAQDLVGRAPGRAEARLKLVRALDHLGMSRDAEEERERAVALLRDAGRDAERGEAAFQGFVWALRRDAREDALRWMREALQADPAVRDEMAADEAMAEFVARAEQAEREATPWFSLP